MLRKNGLMLCVHVHKVAGSNPWDSSFSFNIMFMCLFVPPSFILLMLRVLFLC